MIDPLVHFPEMQRKGYGQSSRAIKRLCERYHVPIVRLNRRQYALRQRDFELLLQRASQKEAA
jgi:predicted amidophosphoribosyltransferase